MKLRKTPIYILLLLVLCFGILGCGKKEEKKEVKIEYKAVDLIKMNSDEVKTILEEKGFTNIVLEPIETKEAMENDKKITLISIAGKKDFEEKDKFDVTSEVIISYWSYKNPNEQTMWIPVEEETTP